MAGKQDPEGRSRAIVCAASAILVEEGAQSLTHRNVAAKANVPLGATTHYFATLADLKAVAIDYLVLRSETALRELHKEVASIGRSATGLTDYLRLYLDDVERLRIDSAICAAALQDSSLQPAIQRWLDGQISELADAVGHDAAEALAMFVDGVTLHTTLRGGRPSFDLLLRAVDAILSIDTPDETSEGGANVR